VISATTGLFTWTPSVTGTFTFKVRVTDNGSPVLFSEQAVTVTVTATAVMVTSANAVTTAKAAEEKTGVAKTALFPNPVTTKFVVTLAAPAEQADVIINDVKGAVIYNKRLAVSGQQFQVDAAAFRPGSYFLQVKTSQGTEVLRFVKL
jgi:hypothetical protein